MAYDLSDLIGQSSKHVSVLFMRSLLNHEMRVYIRVGKYSTVLSCNWFSRANQALATCRRWVRNTKATINEWQRKTELASILRSTQCAGIAESFWRFDDEIVIKCGEWHDSGRALCPRCQRVAELEYPYGWRYYPGDTCKHGVYVGGCGVDHMCGRCENE